MENKVLLIQPNYNTQRKTGAWGVNPPIGLAYIAAVLEQNKIKVEILDANALNWSVEQVADYAKKARPAIVGVSILTPAHQYCLDIIRQLSQNIITVAGGNQSTAMPEELLKQGFKIVVLGEGEYTMLEIAQGKKLSDIQGIAYLENEDIKITSTRPPLDVNALPFPARHLLLGNGVNLPYKSANTQYFPWTGIFTSRGCPYNCYYCFKKTFGHAVRQRSVKNVIDEILFLKNNYNIKEIDIYDDLFNFDLDRAEKILDEIIAKKLDLFIRCSNGLRVDKITPRFIDKLKKAGCHYIAFGIESGDQAVLDKIPKCVTIAQIKEAVKLTKQAGITTMGFFIFGLLGDDKASMQRTIDLSKELDLDLASFTIATPYPGTRLWETVKQKGEIFFTNWDDYHHSTGKMMFTHPEVAASAKEVETMYRKAYWQFYFRPGFILKHFLKIRSFTQIKNMFNGLVSILKAIKVKRYENIDN
ncbi:MAG: radical SAM protein [Patescibacteria group bacterium]|jgi:anaerobic magnesium-protoporphyrin IX monomethyl ester cyclase